MTGAVNRHPSVGHPGKRLMDLLGAALVLVAVSPVLLLASLLVVTTSPGPVLHRRRVLGLGGREFDALKLRTMVADADRILAENPALRVAFERNYKLDQDPRITPLGRLLRKWSIDELPQLVIVLRGEMSLVGPRLITPAELTKYGPRADRLLEVRPGLSGLWQVSGRQEIDYSERVRLDLDYIDHWRLSRDLAIALRTPAAVLRGRGAH
jgi:lipopolysaccharide/colanic/teichoic acid biosynthesis glycosyltransferase